MAAMTDAQFRASQAAIFDQELAGIDAAAQQRSVKMCQDLTRAAQQGGTRRPFDAGVQAERRRDGEP